MAKILVGISGGIDSAVAGFLLKEEGHEVMGVHLHIVPPTTELWNHLNKLQEILGIEIIKLDVSVRFENSIIKYFRDEHLAGRSPSPCAVCNPQFKWAILLEQQRVLGADYVTSGHYIRKEFKDNRWWLKKGYDSGKDQSYFLWGLSQEQLSNICSPLGIYHKYAVKEIAKNNSLKFLSDIKESSGLCFAENLSYTELIKKYIPESQTITEGDVLNTQNNVIGKHNGYIYYTIGQKKGLHFYDKDFSRCVIKIDPEKNQLIADVPEKLWKTEFAISDYKFTDETMALNSKNLEVRIRGFGWNPDGFCKLIKQGESTICVKLQNKAWAPAPGQPAVFYQDNYVVGGGFIS